MSVKNHVNKMWYGCELARKGAFYYEYLKRIDLRRSSQILEECLDIVKTCKKKGIKFSDVESEFTKMSNGCYKFEEDPFAQKIKSMFDEDSFRKCKICGTIIGGRCGCICEI